MKKFLCLPVLILALTGCSGYQLGSSKPSQLAGIQKLAVPTFKNDTLEPRLEVLATNALIKKIQMDGAYQIVPVSEADAVLRGTITTIERSQFRSARSNTLRTSELLMRLQVNYTIEDSAGLPVYAGSARGQSNIVLDPNVQLSERQGLADAAENLSTSMASQISEGW
ncbi:LPS assembly lipoprotein LptE [Phragmitibacter flavus]|nr:LptE family protein [Phragmitibacter flavus]